MTPEITVNQGRLRGSTGTDFHGNTFFKFQGIPYAKPPTGELRFKAPQPPKNWSGIYDATKEGNPCYARDPLKKSELLGSEDCLFLNVFTKKLPDDSNKSLSPVLFWIHGGGFTFGSGNEELYGPEFLMTEEVVLVTINYRLGLFGFASFEDPTLDVSGNAGLKDQVMALKWVQNNISRFGGDPNNVTVFGESAGGASVHLLVLSPMGKGLFHKAIAQSGCALNPWVEGVRGTKVLAKAMNLEGADEKTIYNSLIEKSVEEIYQIQEKMGDSAIPSQRRPLGLVIEKNAKQPFLDEEPLKLIKSGKFSQVPLIIGYTSSEGIISEFHKKPNDPDILPLENVIPWYFECDNTKPETKLFAEKIEKFYFDGKEFSKELLGKKYEMFSDSQFIYGIYTTVINQFPHSRAPIYLYRMSLETDLNFMKKLLKIEVPGVAHCDDIGYLFKNITTPEIKPGSLEETSVKKFVKLWTNFAKVGNPTPPGDTDLSTTWIPVTGPNLNYLDIGQNLVPTENSNLDGMKFWKSLFDESPAGHKS